MCVWGGGGCRGVCVCGGGVVFVLLYNDCCVRMYVCRVETGRTWCLALPALVAGRLETIIQRAARSADQNGSWAGLFVGTVDDVTADGRSPREYRRNYHSSLTIHSSSTTMFCHVVVYDLSRA